ncbi:MAG: DNA repair protein [Eggerthellaceae bacterium]|nr:DNA repair protein [Eggerthellaceae bacterium]
MGITGKVPTVSAPPAATPTSLAARGTSQPVPEPPRAPQPERTYLCIDLKSFYASVECVARGLDPMTTNLVVADPARGEKTICLAVTPAMKALGVRNRCRVFEIPEGIRYIKAKPHMKRYMQVSAGIYRIYLRYISPDDIHVYSIDECFIDATPYLSLYNVGVRELANMLMRAVLDETGIPATAGIGPNLFLAKVALDVAAKHALDRIAVLDEARFREVIWPHRPITDIWNIGPGIARRLAKYRVFDLRGVTQMDVDVLYQEFGANAEYLIDHAWGVEPCTIAEIKAYEPETTSMGNGQVLPCDYTFEEGRMILHEMVDATVLELVEKGLVTSHVSLVVGYAEGKGASRAAAGSVAGADAASASGVGGMGDAESGETVERAQRAPAFVGEHGVRRAGSRYGAHANASRKLPERTNSLAKLMGYVDALYDEVVDPARAIRRVNLAFGNLMPEEFATYDLFTDVEAEAEERNRQEAILAVKQKFGKNALFKGVSLREKATGRERNDMVGGHNG